MRIAIDIQSIIEQKTGVGWYTYNLIQELAKLIVDDEIVAYYFNFLGRFKGPNIHSSNFKCKEIRVLPGKVFNLLWRYLDFPKVNLFIGDMDVFHFPNFIIRPVNCKRKIVTIHDLSFVRFPQYIESKNLLFLRNKIPDTIANAYKIIAISEFTKRELIDIYKVPEEMIEVTHLGVEKKFKPIEEKELLERIRRKYNLPEYFILWVGTLEPRKNLSTLLSAFAIFKKSSEESQPYKLLIAGKKGWGFNDIFKLIEQKDMQNDIIFAGYIPDEDMPFIYNLAKVFVFPSIYEGFGLPPLEALACGTPVIASDIEPLREILGDCAVYVKYDSPEDFCNAIINLIKDEETIQKLKISGLERAGSFRWENTAKNTLKVYKE